MDHYLPNLESPKTWNAWVDKPLLPKPWPGRGDRRLASNGTELELRVRQVAHNPFEQTTTLEIRTTHYSGDSELVVQTNVVDINLCFKKEIELMLAMAGFNTIKARAFSEDRPRAPGRLRALLSEPSLDLGLPLHEFDPA